MRLTALLGGMTRDEMLERMSARELDDWRVFSRVEPFGEPWRRTGMIASTIANVNRDPAKKPDAFTCEDFMPTFTKAGPELSQAEQVEQIAEREAEAERIYDEKMRVRAARGKTT